MQKNKLIFHNKYISKISSKISTLPKKFNKLKFYQFIKLQNIDIQNDDDIIKPFVSDWSNMKGGNADFLVRPKTSKECAIILRTCTKYKIPITISAGQTNLTGSATPYGGVVLSINNLTYPKMSINIKNKEVLSPPGIPLEVMREYVLKKSNHKLYYPVDPTSRNDAYVGGTIACNASGFIPGEKGATRFWVKEIELILSNGYSLKIKRGQYFSNKGVFILICGKEAINLPIPRYKRPQIKNASGPYSSENNEIDFIDLIIGSEGIFGLITECKLKLDDKPSNYLNIFLRLNNEKKALNLHKFLFSSSNKKNFQISAFEYFGYNCQQYMKHKKFLFNKANEVGIYIQSPVDSTTSFDTLLNQFSDLLTSFDSKLDLNNIIILNDPQHWKKFFEARHSIPEQALTKTKKIKGISIITDTIVPSNNLENYLKNIHLKLQTKKIEYLLFGHLGDCHLHFHLIPKKDQEKQCMEIYDFMIDLSSKFGGVYSAEHGTGKRKRKDFIKCYGNDAIKMIRNTKSAIDNNFILNQGNVIKVISS